MVLFVKINKRQIMLFRDSLHGPSTSTQHNLAGIWAVPHRRRLRFPSLFYSNFATCIFNFYFFIAITENMNDIKVDHVVITYVFYLK